MVWVLSNLNIGMYKDEPTRKWKLPFSTDGLGSSGIFPQATEKMEQDMENQLGTITGSGKK